MTLPELRGLYTRLNDEIDALVAAGERNPGRLGRLLSELDEVHRQIVASRRRAWAVPTLRDVIEFDAGVPALRAAG
jgi:hypothetical protein